VPQEVPVVQQYLVGVVLEKVAHKTLVVLEPMVLTAEDVREVEQVPTVGPMVVMVDHLINNMVLLDKADI
jgi:hypothetical protein